MALYLVYTDKGMALVNSDSEMFAKCDIIDTAYVDDPSELQVTEINFGDLPNGVMLLRSFTDGSPQF